MSQPAPRFSVPPSGRGVGAAIDVGSNSIHLLVGIVDEDSVQALADESVQLGLGDQVDGSGSIPAAGRDAIVDALVAYGATASRLGTERIEQLATEPLRRAGNRSVIQSDVLRVTGRPLLVLSQESEAELTLLGVTHGRHPHDRLLVLDVGGGSTEVIVVAPGRDPMVGALPTGSARLSASLVAHDPPTWFEINALRAEARRLVASLPSDQPERGVVVGGSSTNLWRLVPEEPWPGALTPGGLERAFAILAAHPAEDLVATYAISRRRAQQLAAGAALVEAVLARYGLHRLEVSTASLREGAILAAHTAGDGWPQQLRDMVRAEPG